MEWNNRITNFNAFLLEMDIYENSDKMNTDQVLTIRNHMHGSMVIRYDFKTLPFSTKGFNFVK